MKTCFKCNKPKLLIEFYPHPKMEDGRLNKCKACARADAIANRKLRESYYGGYDEGRATNPSRVAARIAYSLTDRGKAAKKRASDAHRLRNRRAYKAQTAVGNAVRDGILVALPCAFCGSPDSEAHHENYDDPLVVVWYCPRDHKMRHRQMRHEGIAP